MNSSFQDSAFESPSKEDILSILESKLSQQTKHTRADFVMCLVESIAPDISANELIGKIETSAYHTL